MLKVWIVGSEGQIGEAINEVLDPLEIEVLNTDKNALDITETDEVLHFGEINRPDVIINCTGITDTDECEKNPEHAYRVNALGARNLSIVARKCGAKIVQLSTDDVFDGKSKKPYTEFDDTNPLTVYGRSKRAGENYVKEFTHKHFIIRSNWVYGKGGNKPCAGDSRKRPGAFRCFGSVRITDQRQGSGKNDPVSYRYQRIWNLSRNLQRCMQPL